jgi:Tfp pilus assembly protein PilF
MSRIRLPLVLAATLAIAACSLKKPPSLEPPPDAQLEARLADGVKQLAEGDPNWAIAAADDVLRWKPLHPGARDLRTRCLIGLGRSDEAADEAIEGVRVQPRKVAPWILYAEALAAGGRRAEAIEALDAAIALSPNAPAPRLSQAAIAEAAGERDHAEAILRKAVELAPFDAQAAAALAAFETRDVPAAGAATPVPTPKGGKPAKNKADRGTP